MIGIMECGVFFLFKLLVSFDRSNIGASKQIFCDTFLGGLPETQCDCDTIYRRVM